MFINSAAQRRHLEKKVNRRARNKRALCIARQPIASERAVQKAVLRARYLDQVELDKLNGLENGAVCCAHYRKHVQRQKPQQQPRKQSARPTDTYRAIRRNALRGPLQSLHLKAQRIRLGKTRSELDRMRRADATQGAQHV